MNNDEVSKQRRSLRYAEMVFDNWTHFEYYNFGWEKDAKLLRKHPSLSWAKFIGMKISDKQLNIIPLQRPVIILNTVFLQQPQNTYIWVGGPL